MYNEITSAIKKRKKSVGPNGKKFKLCKPATEESVLEAESELGFQLPPLLKVIYINSGNGGFGPGYGVMGVSKGFTDDQGKNIVSLYNYYREPDPEDPTWKWPKGLVPICHWGCGIYSCVNCLEPNFPVYSADTCDTGDCSSVESILNLDKPSFQAWVSSWNYAQQPESE